MNANRYMGMDNLGPNERNWNTGFLYAVRFYHYVPVVIGTSHEIIIFVENKKTKYPFHANLK